MYEAFFGLKQRPFPAPPCADRYFPAQSIENARQTLIRTVDRAAGPGLVIGPSGTGKTLLCQVLADHFQGSYKVAMLASGRLCTRRALLQAILFEMELPYRNLEEGELRLSLIDHLEPSPQCPHGLLLLVDEAHTLPLRLLEEVRLITNLVRDGEPRVRLILAGSAALEERFVSPKLESFNQRIAARCYLEALSRDETAGYVRSHLAAVAAAGAEIFTDRALGTIYEATEGIPRLVNQLADHALLLAAAGGRRRVDSDGISEAWSDLQQLPTPWNMDGPESSSQGHDGIVEFGGLDDEPAPAARRGRAPQRDADHPEVRLDRIERQVALAAADASEQAIAAQAEEEFRPAGSIGPEVELIFHGPHDPFTESFTEEELIIDRYASLDTSAFSQRTKVSSAEGREIAELLGKYAAQNPAARPSSSAAAEAATRDARSAQRGGIDPASDPVFPETEETELARPGAPTAPVLTLHQAGDALPEDDRDLIVIEEDEAGTGAAAMGSGRVRRQEYRQLFAKLRQR